MTAEEAIHLDNLRLDAETRFAEAAERCRAQAEYEAGLRSEPPLGVDVLAVAAKADAEAWRRDAGRLRVLTDAPASPRSAAGEPKGLSASLSLDYRRLRAQVAKAEG